MNDSIMGNTNLIYLKTILYLFLDFDFNPTKPQEKLPPLRLCSNKKKTTFNEKDCLFLFELFGRTLLKDHGH